MGLRILQLSFCWAENLSSVCVCVCVRFLLEGGGVLILGGGVIIECLCLTYSMPGDVSCKDLGRPRLKRISRSRRGESQWLEEHLWCWFGWVFVSRECGYGRLSLESKRITATKPKQAPMVGPVPPIPGI